MGLASTGFLFCSLGELAKDRPWWHGPWLKTGFDVRRLKGNGMRHEDVNLRYGGVLDVSSYHGRYQRYPIRTPYQSCEAMGYQFRDRKGLGSTIKTTNQLIVVMFLRPPLGHGIFRHLPLCRSVTCSLSRTWHVSGLQRIGWVNNRNNAQIPKPSFGGRQLEYRLSF